MFDDFDTQVQCEEIEGLFDWLDFLEEIYEGE